MLHGSVWPSSSSISISINKKTHGEKAKGMFENWISELICPISLDAVTKWHVSTCDRITKSKLFMHRSNKSSATFALSTGREFLRMVTLCTIHRYCIKMSCLVEGFFTQFIKKIKVCRHLQELCEHKIFKKMCKNVEKFFRNILKKLRNG